MSIRFSSEDVQRFAAWSADCNPLHVDEQFARQTHFGQRIVHGVLTVLGALRSAAQQLGPRQLRSLDIEFRNAVVIDGVYDAQSLLDTDGLVSALHSSGQLVLSVRGEIGSPADSSAGPDLAWASIPPTHTERGTPARRDIDHFRHGIEVTGTYRMASPIDAFAADAGLSNTQARVLALCSYVTGMELPGLRSLFTRVTVRFHADVEDVRELWYRARTVRFDRQFRILHTELEVVTPGRRLVATAALHSYVPFSPVVVGLDELADRLAPEAARLRGRVALVLGGSRGLGADISASLALAGCTVYVSARHDDAARQELSERLAGKGARVEFLQGDAADPAWCEAALQSIQAKHERLDLLVLNACAPPVPLRVGRESEEAREQYVRDNLRLVEAPLAACAAALDRSSGAVVHISSSFVEETPAGFGHYVAVKQAGEGMVRTLTRECPEVFALVARPPVLQTRWNDTPTGVLGAIPSHWAASHVVNRLAEAWRPGAVEILSEFPPPPVRERDEHTDSPPEFVLRIAASFTTDGLLPPLRFWLKELEIIGAVETAPYGQVLQSLLDPGSVLNAKGRGFNVVLLRVRDWLRELPDEQAGDIEFVRAYLQEMARDLERAMRAHRALAASETLLLVCPSHGALSSAENILVRQTESEIASSCAAVPGLDVVSAGEYHGRYDVNEDEVPDPLRDEIAHIPYRDGYLQVLSTIVARHLHRRLVPLRKVVVVDCDNTLWKGVVGEVGAEGLEFDAGHRILHETLVRLSGTGVLVCLCSKNEEQDVWGVFETRSDMTLRREHVVAATINWQRKSENIRTLASRLNLGLDSFVFIDDNPVECAEVRSSCPEVLTIEWPQEPDRVERLLRHIWELDARKTTKEDQRRTELYREEFRRQELRAEILTFEDFVASLQLVVDFSPMAADDLRRSAQLTLRTNQFNFTTIRREEAELQALVAGGRHEIRTVRVRDRFGDYGLVGLVIAERSEDAWGLDTFLLSCRVLGRGVEHRIVADIGHMAAAAGASTVRLRIDKTKRNTPARSFLETVVPTELCRSDDRAIECDVPAGLLAAVTFEPAAVGELQISDEGESAPRGQAADASRLRRREQQIARAAFDSPASSPTQTAAVEGDLAALVYGAFASALRVPVARVTELDRLEALGCDSLRIVEITVALSEKFPWLPATLLFEQRAVSQIVKEIERLSKPDARSEVPGTTSEPVQRRHRPDSSGAFDIAVVGMQVRCAGASSLEELWELLSHGKTGVKPVPAGRQHFLHPLVDSRPHWAGLLDDAGRFDAEFFGVSPREAEFMDPQLRIFLEVAWGALEDAGYVGTDHEPDTGVFAGVMYGDYGAIANQAAPGGNNPYRCWEGFSLANRLSQLLGFSGPSLAVDTACSSSGTALHLACRALVAGECRVAVVGGVNLILDPDRFGSLARLGILSARGQCEPFGADADGTVLGEGAGVVVLRALEHAQRRGDRIYGVIKGTGLSTGNGTVGFTAPNPQAQAEAIRRSLQAALVDPRTITYVETHGTGTALGDPIEVRGLTLGYATALSEARGLSPAEARSLKPEASVCRLGSIKPNVGHLEAGAGVVGLIKVLLQLHHGMLVPSITSSRPNPQIPFTEIPFDVQRRLEPWERPVIHARGTTVTVPRRAGLSSFGVGGANAHVIVEEAPTATAGRAPASERPAHVLALSAPSDEAVRRQADGLKQYLEGHPDVSLADVCYSVNTGRKHFDHRLAFATRDRDQCIESLRRVADDGGRRVAGGGGPRTGTGVKVAFLFTGQGSQYVGMGRQLYGSQPVFRAALDRCAAIFDVLLGRPLVELLFAREGSPEADLLNQTGFTQPALFAFEYALSELWRSWGVRPDVVMGHSVGELAAMCVAGGVSLDDGLKLIAARGRLMQALPPGGTMTSVMAAEDRVLEAIAGREDLVAIAAINAPGQVVISGVGTAVADISARLAADGIKTKALTVSHAFHSPLMRPMLAEYERVVREVHFAKPHIPLVSCVDGIFTDEITQPGYWLRQVMEPVRFTTGMKTLQEQQVTAFVEIGPQPVLLGMGRQCVSDEGTETIVWLPSLRKDVDNWQTLLESVAGLYVCGASIDWKGFDAAYPRVRVSVPAYPFSQKQYWLKRRDTRPRRPATRDEEGLPDVSATEDIASGAELYQLEWRREPLAVSSTDVQGQAQVARRAQRWMIMADENGRSDDLARLLAQDGATVVSVRPGDRFAREAAGLYRVNPESSDDFGRLWAALREDGQPAPSVVHLWGLDTPGAERLNVAALDRTERVAINGAVHAAQMLAKAEQPGPALWLVTQGAVAPSPSVGSGFPSPSVGSGFSLTASDTISISVAQAPLWGLGRTMALEIPELWGGVIDLSPGPHEGAEIHALARELIASSREDQVALRGAERYVPRLAGRAVRAAGRASFNPDGTYLVTGGLGALGLHVAGWLARGGARHILLTSRHGVPGDEGKRAIGSIERLGASVTVMAADVSSEADVDDVLTVIAKGRAPLCGVIHAAGVDRTVPLTELTPTEVQSVLMSKVRGGWILHERTRDLQLDLFVCFSSIAAVLGSAGRAHYGAANAFLDALVLERRRLGLPGLSVSWGPWQGGGMAAPEQLEQFERIGNHGLDPAEALDALDALVSEGLAQASVAKIDWERFRPAYEARRPRPLVSELGTGATTPVEPARADDVAEWAARLADTPAEMRLPLLVQLLRAEVADTLGFDGPESVPPDKNFYQIGMDSLMMADLVGRLRKRLGFSSTALVFDHPVVETLAASLIEQVSILKPAPTSTPAGPAATVAVVTADVITGYASDVEAEVIEFQKLAWSHRRADWIPSRWRWMFVDSAARLGIEPRIWLYRDAAALVGYMGAIPVRLKIGDEERSTAWLVDTMVLEAYRQQALGSRLMVQAHDDLPFALSLGQTTEMREIQLRLGWKRVAPLEIAQLLIRPENVLKGKLPRPAALAAGWGLRASSAVRDLLRERPRAPVREVARFDERHDRLWNSVAGSLDCVVVRDASYLNWKYVNQPGQDFLRLEIFEGDSVKAVCVLMFREPDDAYRYRRAFLVDLVAPLSDERLMADLLQTACAAAADRGADSILCLHVSKALTNALRGYGFTLRSPERYLLVDPGPLTGPALARVLSAESWFVTQGDSDIDRPW